jgi:hypothetical protein
MNGSNGKVEWAKVFFLGFFCAVALIALMGQRLAPASPQRIGQYQMRMENSQIYVIDTTTGVVKRVAPGYSKNANYKPGCAFDEVLSPEASPLPAEANP